MTRRRRAALLLGLAIILGALAASDVARREAALRELVGAPVELLVARAPLAAGREIEPADLAVRKVPERFALEGAPALPELLVGQRLAVAVPAGVPLGRHLLERAADVIARGSPELVVAGARVDVIVARERATELALEDVEVLAAQPIPAGERQAPGPQVLATLRVTVPQAVYLAAAGTYAAEIRLLVRAPGDRLPTGRPVVGQDLTVTMRERE